MLCVWHLVYTTQSATMAFFSCLKCFQKQEEEEVTELDYAHQSLNDVPNEVFAFERTLEKITLDCNNIRDLPRQLFHCEGLRRISVADNDVHVIPEALSSLTNLLYLNVSKNVLTDIPNTIKQCKQLTILDASVNPLQKIPEGCTQLLSISELYLNDTFLEFLPANFGRLSSLRILELRENGLTSLPKSLNRLVHLERLDLGQNDISELPEVIGSLTNLKELWLDGNKIKELCSFIGNLHKLHHLEVSMNRISSISDAIQNCKLLCDLSISTNDLKKLPEAAIGGLESLITLKVDDNRLSELPMSIGRLKRLEELVVSSNYLESLPPSIGLCRVLHTLNIDDNDIDFLPKEIGSCRSLRILSCHGNRLTSLPAEIDHITNLAVINLTANMIQNLPVSLMKLSNVSAIWLSENQHKPLVQLVQDTCPETGQKVLTNFLLPQQDQDQDFDQKSESGSFHALAWEEERSKRLQIKWAGDSMNPAESSTITNNQSSSLRREPTPFPKEMRAMAKRVQNLRNKKVSEVPADDLQQKKKRRASIDLSNEAAVPSSAPINANNNINGERVVAAEEFQHHQELSVSDKPSIEVKEAKVFNIEPELEQVPTLAGAPLPQQDVIVNGGGVVPALPAAVIEAGVLNDKTSRDSGVSDSGSTPDHDQQPGSLGSTRNPSDPLPQAPVKADLYTNEIVNEVENNKHKPPPYHIAAQMSRHANNFQTLERKSSFMSEMESISGSETSTAPSSLQTIIRAPVSSVQQQHVPHHPQQQHQQPPPPPPPTSATTGNNSETESVYNHANNLRKVSEQMLLGGGGGVSGGSNSTNRNRSSFSSSIPKPGTFKNVAGSEMRPSSYAGPQNTIGLPVLSPTSRLNTTLPTSTTSTLERGSSGIRPPSQLRNQPLQQQQQQEPLQQPQQHQLPSQPPPALLKKSPPPAVPMLNLRPQINGLLTTIEQAAMSDEEPGSPVALNLNESLIMRPASSLGSRIPTPNLMNNINQQHHNQPNYENVVNNKLRESPINSMIPVASAANKKTSLPNDRISTANFVASPPIRKPSLEMAKRTFPSPSSMISPSMSSSSSSSSKSKIPTIAGSHPSQAAAAGMKS